MVESIHGGLPAEGLAPEGSPKPVSSEFTPTATEYGADGVSPTRVQGPFVSVLLASWTQALCKAPQGAWSRSLSLGGVEGASTHSVNG